MLVRHYQKDPARHEVGPLHQGPDRTEHHFWHARDDERVDLTARLVRHHGPTIVFCRTKRRADRVTRQLDKAGVSAAAIHGDRSQAQRERALDAFTRGKVEALVATDVAARGIHVTDVACVVHYDLPADDKDYVHRSGRTGRAGATGAVVSLVGGEHRKAATRLQRTLKLDAATIAPDFGGLAEVTRPAPTERRASHLDESPGRRARPSQGGPRSYDDRPRAGGPRRNGGKPGSKPYGKPGRPKAGARAGGPSNGSAADGRAADRGSPHARRARRRPAQRLVVVRQVVDRRPPPQEPHQPPGLGRPRRRPQARWPPQGRPPPPLTPPSGHEFAAPAPRFRDQMGWSATIPKDQVRPIRSRNDPRHAFWDQERGAFARSLVPERTLKASPGAGLRTRGRAAARG